MPRIAAVVFVLAIVSGAIGYNISRYPLVWEMVRPGMRLDGPAALQAADAPEDGSRAASTTTAGAELDAAAHALPAIPRSRSEFSPIPLSEPTVAANESPPARTRAPAANAEGAEDGLVEANASPGELSQAAPLGGESDRPRKPLVPVPRRESTPLRDPVERSERVARADRPESPASLADDGVQRLPPVDTSTPSPSALAPVRPDGTIPFYPSTRLE